MNKVNNCINNYIYDYLKNKRYSYKSNKLGDVIIRFNTDEWVDVDYECSCFVEVLDRWTDRGSFYEPPEDHIAYDNYGHGDFGIDVLEVFVTIPRYGIRNLKCFINCFINIDFNFDVINDRYYDGSFDARNFEIDNLVYSPYGSKNDFKLIINKRINVNNKVKEMKNAIENDIIPNRIVETIVKDFTGNLMDAIENGVIFVLWK